MMPQPKYGFGEAPVASPHPVFGEKPGFLTRILGTKDDNYWPTEGDVALYKEHMRRLRSEKTVGGRVVPYEPQAFGISGVSREYANRLRVKMVRDEYAVPVDNREWWERD